MKEQEAEWERMRAFVEFLVVRWENKNKFLDAGELDGQGHIFLSQINNMVENPNDMDIQLEEEDLAGFFLWYHDLTEST